MHKPFARSHKFQLYKFRKKTSHERAPFKLVWEGPIQVWGSTTTTTTAAVEYLEQVGEKVFENNVVVACHKLVKKEQDPFKTNFLGQRNAQKIYS